MSEPILRVAAKAVLVNDDGKILLLREAKTYDEGSGTGQYHIPGGRLNPGESYVDALKREVCEETGIEDFTIGQPLFVGEWHPTIKGVPHHIIAIFTVCYTKTSKVKLSHEHDDFQWIDPGKPLAFDVMGPEPEVLAAYQKLATADVLRGRVA